MVDEIKELTLKFQLLSIRFTSERCCLGISFAPSHAPAHGRAGPGPESKAVDFRSVEGGGSILPSPYTTPPVRLTLPEPVL